MDVKRPIKCPPWTFKGEDGERIGNHDLEFALILYQCVTCSSKKHTEIAVTFFTGLDEHRNLKAA